MEDTESRREEKESGRGGETGMYHIVLKNRGGLFCDYILGAFLIKNILNAGNFYGYKKYYFNVEKLSVIATIMRYNALHSSTFVFKLNNY